MCTFKRVHLQTFEEAKIQFWERPSLKIQDCDLENALQCRALLCNPMSAGCKRPKLWLNALQIKVSQGDRAHYELLRRQVVEIEYLSDRLLIQDVHSTAGNDDFYFVFEDFILQSLMIFSRDIAAAQISKQALMNTGKFCEK